jgi:hypothetical protein
MERLVMEPPTTNPRPDRLMAQWTDRREAEI